MVSYWFGLYLLYDVVDQDRVLGVVVVKVEFDWVENIWVVVGGLIYVIDVMGQVILSGDLVLWFGVFLFKMGWIIVQMVVLGMGWIMVMVILVVFVWWVVLLIMGSVGFGVMMLGVGFGGMLCVCCCVVCWVEIECCYCVDLEQVVEECICVLLGEMYECCEVEVWLYQLQVDMVQVNKLVVLGQIIVGVVYEVNQFLVIICLLVEIGSVLLLFGQLFEVVENLFIIMCMMECIMCIIQ